MNEPRGQWLTTSQAAAALHVTPKTIRRRIERGELEARKVARDGGGIVWLVCIGDETLVVTDTVTDTERPSKGTRNAHRKGQAQRVTDTGTPIGKDMGAERKGHGRDGDRVSDLRDDVKFLRGVIEQLQRDLAETHAEHRAALKLIGAASAPQLTAGTPESPEREQSGAANNVPSEPIDDGHRPAKRDGAALSYGDIADELERSMQK